MSLIQEITNSPKKFERTEREKKIENQKQLASPQRVKGRNTSAAAREIQKDSVRISASGKSYLESTARLAEYKAELEKIEILDRERLLESHRRITDNYYDKPEVINKIVDSLLEAPKPEGSPVATATDPAETKTRIQAADAERLAEIRAKIENGDYEAEEVLDVIVDRMLNP